jgi:hypothetical protein
MERVARHVTTAVHSDEFLARLDGVRSRIEPLERLVTACAISLSSPIFYHSGQGHYGYRYGKPGVRHFCLLKAVRAVSALNAMIALARGGFAQEIGVLVRTLVECTTHIEFVLDALDENDVLVSQAVDAGTYPRSRPPQATTAYGI